MSGQENPDPQVADEGVGDSSAETAKQIADLEDSWRRTAAELENLRKRCAQDVVRARQQERASVASRWLPVLDNLERALEHASSHPDQIVDGVRAVHQQALSVLADLGYPRRDDETGKAFDPARHEAVSTLVDEELVPGTVAHVIRPGYGPDNEILRPASVVVATRSE
ncbi:MULTISPECIES: nucleotide exchange factor GrpE [Cryobacterium]|jgi:molecular chaperone GrpE|uniref:Protein GrpE n=1 Tax=Cryobacterium arcticum TaxID=670052 RepID=A0A1B1BHU8_9MICO|nr:MULTISPECIES: nucleotide exchange factor GrpE [Cryobacterium]ANP72195.1 Protein GrpE [Cryobacterium arcticum]